MGGRDEQGKAIESEQAFDSVLPFGVGDLENIAKVDDFVRAQSKFGAQDFTQAGGVRRFHFYSGFAVACAEFADFVFEVRGFGFELGGLFVEEGLFASVVFTKRCQGFLRVAYCVFRIPCFRVYLCTCVLVYFFPDESFEGVGDFELVGSEELL